MSFGSVFQGTRDGGGGEGRGGRRERRWKMKGQQKKRGNYWSFLMEMVMKWDTGLGTMGGQRPGERRRVNCFLLGSHLPTFTDQQDISTTTTKTPRHQSRRCLTSPGPPFPGRPASGEERPLAARGAWLDSASLGVRTLASVA